MLLLHILLLIYLAVIILNGSISLPLSLRSPSFIWRIFAGKLSLLLCNGNGTRRLIDADVYSVKREEEKENWSIIIISIRK